MTDHVRRGLLITVLVVALAGMTIAPVGIIAAQTANTPETLTRGEPEIDVYLPSNELSAGTTDDEAILEFQIQNDGTVNRGIDGSVVTTAKGVTVEVTDDGPLAVKTDETAIGTIEDGGLETVSKSFDVPADVEPGTYDLTIDVSYSYTYFIAPESAVTRDRTSTDSFDVTIEVTDDSRFAIVDASTNAEPGGTGEAQFEVTNVGEEWTNATQMTIASTGEDGIRFDGSVANVYLGDLGPDESTTVTTDIAVADDIHSGSQSIEATFTYDDESGIERTATPVRTGLPLAGSQSFSISNVEDTLAVGYDGVVTGEITNDGPRTVDDAVLVATPSSESLFIEDTLYALPELAPGETTAFRYPTDVSGQADAGPRQLSFAVEYSSGDGTIEYGPMNERVVVDSQHDEFSITGVDTTVAAGERSQVVFEITNERPETLSNIEALVYTDSPLDAPNDDAYVSQLAPGESAEIRFELAADSDASVEDHPIEIDFEYQTEDGSSHLSDAYMIGVSIVDVEGATDDGGGLSIPLVLALLLLIIGTAGVGVYAKQRKS